MKLVKFLKFIEPGEAEKWYNRKTMRSIYANLDEISHITKTISVFYNSKGYQENLEVIVLNMKNGDKLNIEGTEEEIINKLLS